MILYGSAPTKFTSNLTLHTAEEKAILVSWKTEKMQLYHDLLSLNSINDCQPDLRL